MKCCDKKNYNITLNMCDLMFRYKENAAQLISYFEELDCERISLGSYFCGQYFMKSLNMFSSSLYPYIKNSNKKVTIVIPIVKEDMIDNAMKKIEQIICSCADVVDEVVINDYAMLQKIETIRYQWNLSFSITAGRLMVKNFRDNRYPEFISQKAEIYFPLECKDRIDAIEIDVVSQNMDYSNIPQDVDIHMHYPYTYISCGHICEFATVNNPSNIYLQTTRMCGTACMRGYFITKENNHSFYHVGKAVYFENVELKEQSREPERYIYWPLNEIMGVFDKKLVEA